MVTRVLHRILERGIMGEGCCFHVSCFIIHLYKNMCYIDRIQGSTTMPITCLQIVYKENVATT